MLLIRCICAAYWLLLTTLLLMPLELLDDRRIPWHPSDLLVHFLVFALLVVLVLASRLPLGRSLLAGLLVAYATASELLQSLVGRDTAALDLLANLLGLAAGTAIWWGARKHRLRTPGKEQQ